MSSFWVLFAAGLAYLFGRLGIFEPKKKVCSCPEFKGQAYREVFCAMEHLRKAVSDIAMAKSEIGDAEQLKSARLKYGTAERAYIELHNSLIFLFPEEFTDTSVHISDWDLEDASARHQRMQVIIQEAMMIARKDIWANQR